MISALLITLICPGRPADEAEGLKIVHSGQILARIKSFESVEYADVVVEEDLDLTEGALDLVLTNQSAGRSIASEITFENSRFLGTVSFNNTVLERPASFINVEFCGPAYFVNTEFRGGADFSRSEFMDKAMFRDSFLNQTADFAEARFRDLADFGSASFLGEFASFRGARFNDSAIFVAARFAADDVNFEWSEFRASAKFWHATFNEDANFRGAHFMGLLDLQSAEFNGSADFFGAGFEKNVYFNDVKFGTLIVQWASIADKLNCNGPLYMQLIKNFKDLEQFEDADSCYYQYRSWKREIRPIGWAKFFDYLACVSCGYGVRWQNPILSGVLVVVLFGLYFESWDLGLFLWSNLRKGSMRYDYQFKQRLKASMAFSATTLLSLPREWYPFGDDEYHRLLKRHICSSILERLIGWGLMLLLIGTLSRLMVRY